jgi:hypothetical protein
MFAKKLGRVAGLVLALAVVFGGVGMAAGHANESTGHATESSAVQFSTLINEWD